MLFKLVSLIWQIMLADPPKNERPEKVVTIISPSEAAMKSPRDPSRRISKARMGTSRIEKNPHSKDLEVTDPTEITSKDDDNDTSSEEPISKQDATTRGESGGAHEKDGQQDQLNQYGREGRQDQDAQETQEAKPLRRSLILRKEKVHIRSKSEGSEHDHANINAFIPKSNDVQFHHNPNLSRPRNRSATESTPQGVFKQKKQLIPQIPFPLLFCTLARVQPQLAVPYILCFLCLCCAQHRGTESNQHYFRPLYDLRGVLHLILDLLPSLCPHLICPKLIPKPTRFSKTKPILPQAPPKQQKDKLHTISF